MFSINVYTVFDRGLLMRKKNISKRRWKARLLMGKWIPGMVMHHYRFDAPDGYLAIVHAELDFYRIIPI